MLLGVTVARHDPTRPAGLYTGDPALYTGNPALANVFIGDLPSRIEDMIVLIQNKNG